MVFGDRFSLCSPGWPAAHYVDYAGPELTEVLPASASQGVPLHKALHSVINLDLKTGAVFLTEIHDPVDYLV